MSHYDCPCMEKCPLHYAMSLIGGKWKVQILCSVTNAGTIRYNALRGKLPILEQLSDWAEACMPADGATTKKEEPQ